MNYTSFIKKSQNRFQVFCTVLRFSLFIGFYLLCLWMVFLYVVNAPHNMVVFSLTALGGIAILSWLHIRISLGCLIIGVPVVSALHMMKIFPVNPLCFWFAILYLSWCTKCLLWQKKTVASHSHVGALVDILAGLVLLSLIRTLFHHPFDYLWDRLWYHPVITGPDDPMFCLYAAFVLLQGLFLYRIIELEVDDSTGWKKMVWVFYLQAALVIFFSLLQLFFQIPPLEKTYLTRLYSPFNDIHSYGSYIVLLFFFFLALTSTKNRSQGLITAVCSGILFLLVMLSWSRETWVAALLTGMIFLFYKLKKTRAFLFVVSIFIAVALVNLVPSLWPDSKNLYVKRLESTVIVKKINVEIRKCLWCRAVGIIKEYPVAGSGIGTFYKISPSYGERDCERFKGRPENAHNYYLQVAAEIGVSGLLLFLSIIFCAYRSGLRTLSQLEESDNIITGLLFGLTAYLITMLAGHPLLLPNQQLLFWFVIAAITIPGRLGTYEKIPSTGDIQIEG